MKRDRSLQQSVLVLDGDSRRRRDISARLEISGYLVLEAGTVAEAVALLAAHEPCALVLEQRLRDGTALDVAERSRGGRRPFVIVHGDWPEEALPQRPPGVDVCLPHPVLERDIVRLLAVYVPRDRACDMPSVRRGDHLLLVYDGRAELLASLTAYVTCGLAEGERVVIASEDAAQSDELRAHLERSGLDVERRERNRALVLVTHNESYLVGGRFAPRLMLGFVRDLVAAALVDGFAGLRAAGGGSWIPGTPEDREAWFHYETEIQSIFTGFPLTGLCLYDRASFHQDLLLEALHTHPVMLDGRVVCENRYYGASLPAFGDPACLDQRLAEVRRARRLDS